MTREHYINLNRGPFEGPEEMTAEDEGQLPPPFQRGVTWDD